MAGNSAGYMDLVFCPRSSAQAAIQGFDSRHRCRILAAAAYTAHDPTCHGYWMLVQILREVFHPKIVSLHTQGREQLASP